MADALDPATALCVVHSEDINRLKTDSSEARRAIEDLRERMAAMPERIDKAIKESTRGWYWRLALLAVLAHVIDRAESPVVELLAKMAKVLP